MTRAERAALERELEDVRKSLVACCGERDGFDAAMTWAERFGDDPAYARASDLAIEAEANVAYYGARVERLEHDLAEDDTRADDRAFERDCGAR